MYRDAKYNTSKKELDKRYHNLQKGLHPDKYVSDSKEIQNLATEYSTYINMAYRVLQDDERRAKYLVTLYSYSSSNLKLATYSKRMQY